MAYSLPSIGRFCFVLIHNWRDHWCVTSYSQNVLRSDRGWLNAGVTWPCWPGVWSVFTQIPAFVGASIPSSCQSTCLFGVAIMAGPALPLSASTGARRSVQRRNTVPENAARWPGVGSMMAQRLPRRSSTNPTPDQRPIQIQRKFDRIMIGVTAAMREWCLVVLQNILENTRRIPNVG